MYVRSETMQRTRSQNMCTPLRFVASKENLNYVCIKRGVLRKIVGVLGVLGN
jgi:hypothetical protein